MSTIFYIDDVAAVVFTTSPHVAGQGGNLRIRVVSRAVGAEPVTTEVCLCTWNAKGWDLLRDVERAQAAAQAAGNPQPAEDVA